VKKLIGSVLIGGVVGALLACGFIFIAPKLPDIFADAFYFRPSENPTTLVQNLRNILIPSTEQYFIASVDQTIATSTKVVYADLNAMEIVLFENGTQVETYPIQSVGREGTAWQTPLGKFDMSYKNANHFSSIGHVWMPFSMHFFGNYFIHGWPYYAGGMPVAEGYSGGCIRLNTPDAQKIFDFVDKHTQLIVTISDKQLETQTDFEYQIKNSKPSLDSKFLVADLETGEVVASKDAKEVIAIDSFAKLMAGLISLETLNQYQEAVLDQNIVSIADVLYALLLGDANDAGKLLSEHKNKKQYLLDMNTRAHSLGMDQTLYTDVNGVDSTTISSLEDSFKLLQYFKGYKPFVLKVLSLDHYTLGDEEQKVNHPLQDLEEYIAGFANTSNTEMITLVTLDVFSPQTNSSAPKTFAIIVHGSADAGADTRELYEWVKGNVELR
jgi:hypothetical protein